MIYEIPTKLTPVQLAHFYDFPLKYTGKGQSIAIISLGGQLNMDELKQDFHALRVAYPSIGVVDVDPENISARQNGMGTGETHLDVEVIGCICPDATITIYRGSNPRGFTTAIARAIEDDCSVISISWGGPEQPGAAQGPMEQVLQQAVDKGITVCAAAGDGGSSDHRNDRGAAAPAADDRAHVDYPASSPLVLACGGTELLTENGLYGEAVWNNSSRGGGAGGGGVSEVFARPDYQTSAGIDIRSANTGEPGRVVPDVAGLAAGGDWKIYESRKNELIGGTSAVAPLWASLIALVNERRAAAKKARLGFINERLYQLAAQGGGLLRDVRMGNNRSAEGYPGYDAVEGFDACTGWGTPVGSKLAEALFNLD